MSANKTIPPRAVVEKAGDWFLRREAGLSPTEQAELEAWLAEKANHRQAFEEFGWTLHELNQPRAQGLAEVALKALDGRRERRVHRRRQLSFVGAGLAAAALVVFAFVQFSAPPTPREMPPSVAVRPDRQVLPDGSVVELNAGADYEVRFTARERGIRLLRGEALFMVRKDASRPFVVSTGTVAVRAVGTAFSVRNESSAVDVLVTEGRVAVERIVAEPSSGAGERGPTFVSAGGRISVPVATNALTAPQPIRVTPTQITQSLAWRTKRIEFTDTPLADVLELFNRANTLRLQVADAATGQLEVSGIFWADDPETFVRLIEAGLGLRSERTGDRITLRQK